MRKKIFISSTYIDLIAHRNQVFYALQGFDVEILGMEYFGARKSSPLETCIKEVEICDIYIAIIGLRYGSVNKALDKSFTQIEYERALEQEKDVRIFLLDEHDGNIKTRDIDFGIQLEKLLHFREILKSNHTVEFFTDEIDLGKKIYKAFKDDLPVSIIDTKRPEKLDCRILRYKTKNLRWICFIGYLHGRPFEIYNALADDEDGILLPRSINEGVLTEVIEENNYHRIDFTYVNNRGYRTTLERINSAFNPLILTYDKILSTLMSHNVERSIIINTVKEMKIKDQDELADWNKTIIEILQECI